MKLPTDPESLAPIVVDAMSSTPHARLRELMASLVGHLHRFAIDHAVTPAELEVAIAFVTAPGQAALLGPFWRAGAPLLEAGASTAGTPLEVGGTVHGADGRPLAGAVVDVWQADPTGCARARTDRSRR